MPRARKKPSNLKSICDRRTPTADYDLGAPRGYSVPKSKLSVIKDAKEASKVVSIASGRSCHKSEVAPVKGDANGRKYRRSIHPLEQMHKKGQITRGQMLAGLRLSEAYEAQFKSPSRDYSQDRVDSTKMPDSGVIVSLSRQHAYISLENNLPRDSVSICRHVCCLSRYIRDGFAYDGYSAIVALEHLQMGLDVLSEY